MISGAIITYNEANKFSAAINSLKKVCDEIVVMDSYSDDGTPIIASSVYGCRVYQYEFDNFRDQKNRVIQRCNGDWVILLDADERLDDELIKEIPSLISWADSEGIDALTVPRNNIIGLEEKVGWPDIQTRIFKNYVRHFDNPIHPQSTMGANRIVQVLSRGSIIHKKSTTEQRLDNLIYYTLRPGDYGKPPYLCEDYTPDPKQADYSQDLDMWVAVHKRERRYTEVKEFR